MFFGAHTLGSPCGWTILRLWTLFRRRAFASMPALITRAPRKRALARLAATLERPLTIGIAGEAGSGKSTLLNALLGTAIVPAGGLGRVRPVFRARYGEEYAAYSIEADGSRHRLTSKGFERASAGQAAFAASHPKVIYSARGVSLPAAAKPDTGSPLIEVRYPAPVLKHVELAELPASFDPASLSPAIRNFARVDIAIWITPAHQAWKRSELLAWQDLRLARPVLQHRRCGQMDGLAAAEDREKLMARLARDTASIFKACYPVSAQQALDAFANPAQCGGVSGLWAASIAKGDPASWFSPSGRKGSSAPAPFWSASKRRRKVPALRPQRRRAGGQPGAVRGRPLFRWIKTHGNESEVLRDLPLFLPGRRS